MANVPSKNEFAELRAVIEKYYGMSRELYPPPVEEEKASAKGNGPFTKKGEALIEDGEAFTKECEALIDNERDTLVEKGLALAAEEEAFIKENGPFIEKYEALLNRRKAFIEECQAPIKKREALVKIFESIRKDYEAAMKKQGNPPEGHMEFFEVFMNEYLVRTMRGQRVNLEAFAKECEALIREHKALMKE